MEAIYAIDLKGIDRSSYVPDPRQADLPLHLDEDACRDCGHSEDEHDFDGCYYSDAKTVCDCQRYSRGLSPMPYSGATKLSPRESAERSATE